MLASLHLLSYLWSCTLEGAAILACVDPCVTWKAEMVPLKNPRSSGVMHVFPYRIGYVKKVMISALFSLWHADEDLQSKGKNDPNVTRVTALNQTWKVNPAHGMHCFKRHVTN